MSVKPTLPADYVLPTVWAEDPSKLGPFANAPTAGPRDSSTWERPKGDHPIQIYSMGTPNGVKVTMLLEELVDKFPDFEYDAWLVRINGDQFSKGFVEVNPNSKIPAMLHYPAADEPPIRVFESANILMYICENFDQGGAFYPTELRQRTECLNWVFWLQGSTPYLGGGFGHFYNYAPIQIEYAIDRFTMEAKRQLDVLERHLGGADGAGGGPYLCGEEYTIADMAVYPWYGWTVLGKLYAGSETFLGTSEYPKVMAWAERIAARPATIRGTKVNRVFGGPSEQLLERHARSDFENNMQDMVLARAAEAEK